MDAVVLALLSAALFGAMTVAIRIGLTRGGNEALAPVAMTGLAFVVSGSIAAVVLDPDDVVLRGVWPFLLAGLLAPGFSNLFFTRAVAEAGASRASIVVGTAPLVAVLIALTALREPIRAPLVAGAVLIVLGGIALARERVRPDDFRLVGLGFAFAATILFSTRDNLVRWLSGDTDVPPLAACSATLLAGTALLMLISLRSGQVSRVRLLASLRAFAPAGLLFGLSYAALFEAYYRGRVTVVSPLVATESLWGVTLSALLIGSSELVGRRLLAGAALVVAGGALIGAAS
jgi:uncharacterized membrane protein